MDIQDGRKITFGANGRLAPGMITEQPIVIAAASGANKKYFFEHDFDELPKEVKDEIKELCIVMADKLHCAFLMGFSPGGKLFIQIIKEDPLEFDEIGAELEVNRIKTQYADFLGQLEGWYAIRGVIEQSKKKFIVP